VKNVLRYKGFLGSIEISILDNCIHGKLLFIEDLITYEAESPAQIENEFKEAVDDYIETCKQFEREPLKPFSGTFNIRIGSELHQTLAQYATIHDTSINDVVKRALSEYLSESRQQEIIHTHKHTHTIRYEENIEFNQEVMLWKGTTKLNLVN
jgi:predicted HicB family RNase H-like nuclease